MVIWSILSKEKSIANSYHRTCSNSFRVAEFKKMCKTELSAKKQDYLLNHQHMKITSVSLCAYFGVSTV